MPLRSEGADVDRYDSPGDDSSPMGNGRIPIGVASPRVTARGVLVASPGVVNSPGDGEGEGSSSGMGATPRGSGSKPCQNVSNPESTAARIASASSADTSCRVNDAFAFASRRFIFRRRRDDALAARKDGGGVDAGSGGVAGVAGSDVKCSSSDPFVFVSSSDDPVSLPPGFRIPVRRIRALSCVAFR